MRKRLIIISSFITVLLLSSCSLGKQILGRYSHDDQGDANAKMDKVLEAIKNKDKDALKALFSKKAIAEVENFDQSIIELFDFFQGDFISYNDWSAVGVEEGMNDDGTGRHWKCMDSTYDVETSKQKYRFAIQDFTIDTADPDNVGIYSLYIIKMEDDTDQNFAYRGDGKYTPGINFNKKNLIPDENNS